jgi:hypothetical protein
VSLVLAQRHVGPTYDYVGLLVRVQTSGPSTDSNYMTYVVDDGDRRVCYSTAKCTRQCQRGALARACP